MGTPVKENGNRGTLTQSNCGVKWLRFSLFILLLLFTGLASAQKEIVIDDQLAANSEKLQVSMKVQSFGKIWNFKFGEYAVGTSKNGWTTTTGKSNLFNTKTESTSTQKFSFELKSKSYGSALVNAAQNMNLKTLQALSLSPHISFGSDGVAQVGLGSLELVQGQESLSFSAYINLSQDTTEAWSLYMDEAFDEKLGAKFEAFLTDGVRTILIFPTHSNKNGDDPRKIPALGYEFVEDGVAKSSLQYYGGGAFGANKNIVWLSTSLDAKNKLILAAAMTAVLQVKANLAQ